MLGNEGRGITSVEEGLGEVSILLFIEVMKGGGSFMFDMVHLKTLKEMQGSQTVFTLMSSLICTLHNFWRCFP